MSARSTDERQAEIIEFPRREFVVEVTYVMRVRHMVRATSGEEAEHLAPDAAINCEPELVDIIGAATLAEVTLR